MKATVYSTKSCPNCASLKELLRKEGIDVEEADMQTASVATELFYTMYTPCRHQYSE